MSWLKVAATEKRPLLRVWRVLAPVALPSPVGTETPMSDIETTTDISLTARIRRKRPPLAVLLGTNEIASALAVHLRRAGFGVVMSHDPQPPVIRRGMAFHDALFGSPCTVDGITAIGVECIISALQEASEAGHVVVTHLSLCDLLVIRGIDVLIDARMQKQLVTPDFRNLAGLTIGLGPGFTVGGNCDVAVETRPARNGALVREGSTDAADGLPAALGGAGSERFVYANEAGEWRTAFDFGVRVYRGMTIGRLNEQAVIAPINGMLRGIARDGTTVPVGAKLLEVDPRGWAARWTGIDERGHRIAVATLEAVMARLQTRKGRGGLRLVHSN